MKKTILVVLLLVAAASCQQKSTERYTTTSPEIDVLKAGIESYESGDWEKWKSHFTADGEIYVNSKDSINVDERLEQLKAATNVLSSYGFDKTDEWIEMVMDGNDETWVYYWAQWNGEIAANQQKISIPVHIAAEFVDGKIAEEHIYFDSTEMNKELAALSTMTDLDKKIHSQIETLIDTFTNKQDFSVLGDLIADGHVRYINDVKVATGPTELQASMAPYFTAFPDFNIKILRKSVVTENNSVFIYWEMNGTNSGEFAGQDPTGKKIKNTGLSRLHFNAEGKLDEENIFFDNLNVFQQLGHTKIPTK